MYISVLPPHLFSMASMFLRSSRTCRELPSSLSEKSRWWPVMHRVPLLGGCSGCRSTTSATLAVLMCSENSISSPRHRHNTPPLKKRNHALLNFCCGLQITSSPQLQENESALPPLLAHSGWGGLQTRSVCLTIRSL